MLDCTNDFIAHRARALLIALGQHLGLSVAYCAFERAAELEDNFEIARAAAWQALGRVIIVALSTSRNSEKYEISAAVLSDVDEDALPDVRLLNAHLSGLPHTRVHLQRLANSLGFLLESGRKGGSISAGSVLKLAQNVQLELVALLRELDAELARGEASTRTWPRPGFRDS